MAKVQPIRDKAKIEEIEDELFRIGTPRGDRMFVMFDVGIYLGMRIGDMLKLRVGDIRGKTEYTFFPEKEDAYSNRPNHKPKKLTYTIGPELRSLIGNMYEGKPDDAFLFPSRKKRNGKTCAIGYRAAYEDMKYIASLVGIPYNVAAHSLRKTFGYHVYQKTHDIAWLQEWFGHSSAAYTLIYIGIADDEKRRVTDKMPYGNRSRFDYKARREKIRNVT